jgi:malate dehydrogenase (oxaloacetate-decarboxylating)(NADP+)
MDTGLIYPHQSQIFEASIHVAVKVAERIFDDNLAGISRPADVEAHVRKWAYRPEYPPYQ